MILRAEITVPLTTPLAEIREAVEQLRGYGSVDIHGGLLSDGPVRLSFEADVEPHSFDDLDHAILSHAIQDRRVSLGESALPDAGAIAEVASLCASAYALWDELTGTLQQHGWDLDPSWEVIA